MLTEFTGFREGGVTQTEAEFNLFLKRWNSTCSPSVGISCSFAGMYPAFCKVVFCMVRTEPYPRYLHPELTYEELLQVL